MDERTEISTRSGFQAAIREAVDRAAARGARELCFVDDTFADWPLNEIAIVDRLTHWAGAQRRLVVLARRYDEVVRRHPRWVQWRRTWAHVVQCRAASVEANEAPLQSLLLAQGVRTVWLVDPLRHRGFASSDPADALRWREPLDALLQRSEEAFGATTLGL